MKIDHDGEKQRRDQPSEAAKEYFDAVLTPNQAFIAHICLNTLNKSHVQDPKGTADWTELLDSGKTDGLFWRQQDSAYLPKASESG